MSDEYYDPSAQPQDQGLFSGMNYADRYMLSRVGGWGSLAVINGLFDVAKASTDVVGQSYNYFKMQDQMFDMWHNATDDSQARESVLGALKAEAEARASAKGMTPVSFQDQADLIAKWGSLSMYYRYRNRPFAEFLAAIKNRFPALYEGYMDAFNSKLRDEYSQDLSIAQKEADLQFDLAYNPLRLAQAQLNYDVGYADWLDVDSGV